jgi:hypothetical protein
MPYDKHPRRRPAAPPPEARVSEPDAAAAAADAIHSVCDLLASAEEARLRGQQTLAALLMYRAERAALRSGMFHLICLVWRHAPQGHLAA